MNTLPPWLEPAIAELRSAIDGDRLPHALLISGARGLGKSALLRWLGRRLHCRRPSGGDPCGACDSCRQHDAQCHPDWLPLAPPEPGKGKKGGDEN